MNVFKHTKLALLSNGNWELLPPEPSKHVFWPPKILTALAISAVRRKNVVFINYVDKLAQFGIIGKRGLSLQIIKLNNYLIIFLLII